MTIPEGHADRRSAPSRLGERSRNRPHFKYFKLCPTDTYPNFPLAIPRPYRFLPLPIFGQPKGGSARLKTRCWSSGRGRQTPVVCAEGNPATDKQKDYSIWLFASGVLN